jgi:exodeoxyribonuclease V
MTPTDKKLTRADLSPDQAEVYDAIWNWHLSPTPLLTTGGLGGTGKSTLLGVFASETKLRVAYCCFTGRAASVLQRKLRAAGASFPVVTTIHGLLYLPVVDPKTEEILGWKKRTKLPEADLIVIDEASMVSKAMLHDLEMLGRPILAVGDHGQLPPVMDSGDLMRDPDLRLEKIHRQAEGSPIIRLAHSVRETGKLDRKLESSAIRFRRRANAEQVIAAAYAENKPMDVALLCYTNKTRIRLNAYARKALAFRGCPNEGEVVMCLKNAAPIFNGMRGVLRTAGTLEGWKVKANVEFPEEGLPSAPLEMFAGQFNREKTMASTEEAAARGIHVSSLKDLGLMFDFGYAMTCHKSQGSSFPHVIVYLDRDETPSSDDWKRWMYTAATRAAERLTILC